MPDVLQWRWGGKARALAVALALVSGAAHAQFANRSIGFSGGYIRLNDNILNQAIPFGLLGTYYLEDGLEVTARVHGMIVTLALNGTQAFAAGGGLGIRYLFLQENFRPYVGAEMSYFQAFFEQNGGLNYVGVSPAAGFDVMFGSQFSLGPRAQVNIYWMLNRSINVAWEVTGEFAAYF
jgi:outer membrane protein